MSSIETGRELFDSLSAASLYRATTQDASSAESNKVALRIGSYPHGTFTFDLNFRSKCP